MMIISLYIAMWLSYIAGTTTTWIWTLITILPGISSSYMFFYIVKTASLLKAISILDHDLMIETIEDTQTVKQLSDELRAKVIQQLNTTATSNDNNSNDSNNNQRIDPYKKLESIFKDLDSSQNGYLSLTEFLQLSEILDINFSKRRWKQVYRIIDKNFDNQVSFQEFYVFLYPEHELAKSLENRRMKIIKKRVLQTANDFFHKNISNSAAKIRQLFSFSCYQFSTSTTTATSSNKEGGSDVVVLSDNDDGESERNSFYSKSLQALTRRSPNKVMKITAAVNEGSNSIANEVIINIQEKDQIVIDDNQASGIATNIDSTTSPTITDPSTSHTIMDPSTSPNIIDPSTSPTITDPSTSHTIMDPSTSPNIMNPSTSHTIIDPSTSPTITDPSTSHTIMDPSTSHTIMDPSTSPNIIDPSTSPTIIDSSTSPNIIDPSTSHTIMDPSTSPNIMDPSTSPTIIDPSTSHTIMDPSTSPTIIDSTIVPSEAIEESTVITDKKHLNTTATLDYDEHHDGLNDNDHNNFDDIDGDVIETQFNHPYDDISLISNISTLARSSILINTMGGDMAHKSFHPSDYDVDQKAARITAMMTAKNDDDNQQDDKYRDFDHIIGANDDDGDRHGVFSGDHINDGGNSVITYEECNYSDGDSYEDVEDPMLCLSADSMEIFRDHEIRIRR